MLKNLIQSELKDENIIDFDFVREKIAKYIELSEDSIETLLADLRNENSIIFDEV